MLVIHIGTHKTGTSALQNILTRNSDRLLKQGIDYVQAGREGAAAHHELARALRNRGPKASWQRVRQELSESESGINLLSSEGFWFCDPATLKEQIPGVQDVRIVVYLRRQDKYMQSLYKQAVAGGRKITFMAWLQEMGHRGNYLPVIEQWVAQFGKDAITIRPYEREGGTVDIIDDFGSFLGCDLVDEQMKGKIRGNASPRRELLHFIRAFNRLNLEVNRDELFYALLRMDKEYTRSGDLLAAAEGAAMMHEYTEENRLLVERYYGNNQAALFPEFEEDTAPPVFWSLEDRAFFKLTADVLDVVIGLAADGKIKRKGARAKRKGVKKVPEVPESGSVESESD